MGIGSAGLPKLSAAAPSAAVCATRTPGCCRLAAAAATGAAGAGRTRAAVRHSDAAGASSLWQPAGSWATDNACSCCHWCCLGQSECSSCVRPGLLATVAGGAATVAAAGAAHQPATSSNQLLLGAWAPPQAAAAAPCMISTSMCCLKLPWAARLSGTTATAAAGCWQEADCTAARCSMCCHRGGDARDHHVCAAYLPAGPSAAATAGLTGD